MLIKILTDKSAEEITVEDLCQLRDEFDKFMQELATEVINKQNQ